MGTMLLTLQIAMHVPLRVLVMVQTRILAQLVAVRLVAAEAVVARLIPVGNTISAQQASQCLLTHVIHPKSPLLEMAYTSVICVKFSFANKHETDSQIYAWLYAD